MLCWGEYKKPQVCTTGVPTPKVGRQASLGAFLVAQVVKNLPVNAGDPGSIPGWRRSPGEGNGNPFQYSCLETSTDRGAWWVTVHGVTKSRPQLSDEHFHLCVCKEMAELNFERQIKTVHKEKPGMAHRTRTETYTSSIHPAVHSAELADGCKGRRPRRCESRTNSLSALAVLTVTQGGRKWRVGTGTARLGNF